LKEFFGMRLSDWAKSEKFIFTADGDGEIDFIRSRPFALAAFTAGRCSQMPLHFQIAAQFTQ
jgi:hypothetical protein